jgi:1,4-dihydroxy-2-naphthoate octaprenyltransferase
VRLGRARARRLFAAMVALSVIDERPELLLGLLALPIVAPLVRTVSSRTDGPSLNQALARCGALLALFSLLLSGGLLLSR